MKGSATVPAVKHSHWSCGPNVGALVGATDGLDVGDRVGPTVGLGDGAAEGVAVGGGITPLQHFEPVQQAPFRTNGQAGSHESQ